MNFKVEVGEYEVISSGVVVTNSNDDVIRFFIEDLTFEFQFITDCNTTNHLIKEEKISNKKNITKFINFNHLGGNSNIEPSHVGTLNDKKLFFNYKIFTFKGDKGFSGKRFYYTWLLKK